MCVQNLCLLSSSSPWILKNYSHNLVCYNCGMFCILRYISCAQNKFPRIMFYTYGRINSIQFNSIQFNFQNAHARITFRKSFAFTCPRIRLSTRITIQNALFSRFKKRFKNLIWNSFEFTRAKIRKGPNHVPKRLSERDSFSCEQAHYLSGKHCSHHCHWSCPWIPAAWWPWRFSSDTASCPEACWTCWWWTSPVAPSARWSWTLTWPQHPWPAAQTGS